MQSLVYCLEFNDNVSIKDIEGRHVGDLEITLSPTDKNGNPLPDELNCVEDPEDLLGHPYAFKVSFLVDRLNFWTTLNLRIEPRALYMYVLYYAILSLKT